MSVGPLLGVLRGFGGSAGWIHEGSQRRRNGLGELAIYVIEQRLVLFGSRVLVDDLHGLLCSWRFWMPESHL